jgi:uncharacterized protein YkwD
MKPRSSPWAPILAGLALGVAAALLMSLARAETTAAFRATANGSAAAEPGKPAREETVEAEMVRLTNQERRRDGLPELTVDASLTVAARGHSRAMAQHRALAHGFPGESDLTQRLADVKVRFDAAGENVSSTSADDPAASAHEGLMLSPPHRANILGRTFTALGVGVVRRDGTYYVTEDFARVFPPLSADDIEHAITRELNQVRRRENRKPLRIEHIENLERLACTSNVTPDILLGRLARSHGALVFTTFELDELPKAAAKMALNPAITEMSVKACPMPRSLGGNGGFEVSVVFFTGS